MQLKLKLYFHRYPSILPWPTHFTRRMKREGSLGRCHKGAPRSRADGHVIVITPVPFPGVRRDLSSAMGWARRVRRMET